MVVTRRQSGNLLAPLAAALSPASGDDSSEEEDAFGGYESDTMDESDGVDDFISGKKPLMAVVFQMPTLTCQFPASKSRPAAKRAKTKNKSSRKSMKGKGANLSRIVNMPLDILFEVRRVLLRVFTN
jgi:hypothetical protein